MRFPTDIVSTASVLSATAVVADSTVCRTGQFLDAKAMTMTMITHTYCYLWAVYAFLEAVSVSSLQWQWLQFQLLLDESGHSVSARSIERRLCPGECERAARSGGGVAVAVGSSGSGQRWSAPLVALARSIQQVVTVPAASSTLLKMCTAPATTVAAVVAGTCCRRLLCLFLAASKQRK